MSVLTFEKLDRLRETHGCDYYPPPEDVDPARLAGFRQAIASHIRSLPVYEQYVRRLRLSGPTRNRFGWHAEGERLYAASILAAAGPPRGARILSADGELPSQAGVGLAAVALSAQVYLWSEEIEELATAAPLPQHVVSRDALPFPSLFWSREVAHVGLGCETNWALILDGTDGFRVVMDLANGQARTVDVVSLEIPYGATFPDDFPEGPERQGVASVLARLAFLASPYTSNDTERVPRAWRREAVRAGVPESATDPLVRVVKLRRESQENVERERQDRESAARERRSHWWVSGHYRAQWYPSKQAHDVIWIAPHLKGDLSKPLANKVYAVVR